MVRFLLPEIILKNLARDLARANFRNRSIKKNRYVSRDTERFFWSNSVKRFYEFAYLPGKLKFDEHIL